MYISLYNEYYNVYITLFTMNIIMYISLYTEYYNVYLTLHWIL